jgi:uncharacterized protein (TIGR03000 family)
MAHKLVGLAVFAIAALLFESLAASACGELWSYDYCCYYCPPCPPCPPLPPCGPRFTFRAYLTNPSGLMDPDQRVPFEVAVTNGEAYAWEYFSSEYRYWLFDDRGCLVPDPFVLPYEFRRISVPAGVSVLDPPNVRLKKGSVALGRRYTMVVDLRGHESAFHFTPFLELRMPTARAGDASLILDLPPNAQVRVNGEETPVSSTTARFAARGLRPGQTYTYHFECAFVRDGRPQTVVRHVDVRAGDQLHVDFRPATTAAFIVSLPPNAALKVNGEATPYTSPTARFMAFDLRPGQSYQYEFQCSFTRDGRLHTATRTVTVHAGEEARVDLTAAPALVASNR